MNNEVDLDTLVLDFMMIRLSLENIDAANDMEGTRDFWDGVDTGLSACRQIARKALEGGKS
jgi:hypothetical protein